LSQSVRNILPQSLHDMPLPTNTSNRGKMFLKLLHQHADFIVDAASSQTTGLFLKYDSFAR
jgi:hypothetical protein